MARNILWGAGAFVLAVASMSGTPAHAARGANDMDASLGSPYHAGSLLGSAFDLSVYDAEAQTTEWRGRRGWGRGGWGRRGWRGHRRGVRAGDVLAGVAILGGIAAIASAANNRRRDRDVVIVDRDNRYERDREWQQEREIDNLRRRSEEQQREIDYLRSRGIEAYRAPPSARFQTFPEANDGPIDIDDAIDRCVEVIEIDASVSEIDSVDRTGTGWTVSGRIADGNGFTCRIGSDGQIDALENGEGFSRYEIGTENRPADNQWSVGQYADARAALGQERRSPPGQPLVPLTSDTMPAYPGGPLPGGESTGGMGAIEDELGG